MKLRLGPLPRTDVVKLSVALPIELKERLERYCDLFQVAWGGERVEVSTLIPHMLEQFLAKDRAFRQSLREHSRAESKIEPR